MKWTLFITIGFALGGCDRLPGPDRTAAQQIEQMRQAMEEFPRGTRYSNLACNVQKTDSLMNPIIGYIDCTDHEVVPERLVFHWVDGRWQFVQFYNRENGLDFGAPQGDGMAEFLAHYGYASAPSAPVATAMANAATPALHPRATPFPTPNAATQRAQILQKYGKPQ